MYEYTKVWENSKIISNMGGKGKCIEAAQQLQAPLNQFPRFSLFKFLVIKMLGNNTFVNRPKI